MGAFHQLPRGMQRGIAVVLLALALGACSRAEPIVVAGQVWLGYEPMFLAESLGWLDPQQVRLLQTIATSDSLAALHSGEVDGAALTLDEVLRARAQGLDLRIVLVFNVSVGADVLLARPPLVELIELGGLRVGFEHGSVGHLLAAKALSSAGMSLADVEPVHLPVDQHLAAWDARLVDALATYEPTASRLRAAGAVVIFDSSQIPTAIVDVLAFRNDRLTPTTRSAVRHLIASHMRALEHLNNHPEDAAFRMTDRLALPVEQVLPAFRGLILPDLMNNHRLMSGNPSPLLQSSEDLLNFKLSSGLLAEAHSLDDLIVTDYLPRIGRQARP